jgi:hypothetical protein
MSYKELKMYTIICDGCGKDLQDGELFAGWSEKSYLDEEADNKDWVEVDDKNYCDECHEYNDNDELVIFNKNEQI